MIEETQAINYIKQYIKTLESDRNRLDDEIKALGVKKTQLVLDRKALTGRESAFLAKVDGHGMKVERIEGLYKLAISMKEEIRIKTDDLDIKSSLLNKREVKVELLEEKKIELDKREEKIGEKESNIDERELKIVRDKQLIKKDKEAAREKASFLALREKGINKKQEQLQKMLEAQKV